MFYVLCGRRLNLLRFCVSSSRAWLAGTVLSVPCGGRLPLVLSSTRQIEISGFLWAQKKFSPESFSRLEPVPLSFLCVAMLAQGTRRRGCSTGAHGTKCAWCKHMRGFDHACTWKPRGQQDKFVSAADVSAACFGHMVASVWDGSVVRRYNKYCLKRCLAMSVSERGSGEDAPPQHAWAAALLTPAITARKICLHDNKSMLSAAFTSASASSI